MTVDNKICGVVEGRNYVLTSGSVPKFACEGTENHGKLQFR